MEKIIPLLISCLLLLYSCKKENSSTDQKRNTTEGILKKDTLNAHPKQQTETLQTGKKPSDLVPNGYEIQYDAEGDLNQDGLTDVALVIRKKEDTLAGRKMLILLKKNDKTYKLDKISTTVFPDEYNESGYKMHDTEDITIENGGLSINLYDVGPNGNLFSRFKYLNGQFILTYIETYSMGAGSHSAMYYEPMKGKLIQETVNTMEEEMPSEAKKIQLKKEIFLFEKASPEGIIRNLYNSVGD